MKSLTKITLTIIAIIFTVVNFACTSTSSDPLSLSSDRDMLTSEISSEGKEILAAYHVVVDTSTGEIEISPSREIQKHFNISNMASKHDDWLSEIWIDKGDHYDWFFKLRLKNPTALTAYDVRAIYIPNPYSGDYLDNADDYTNRWQTMAYEWVNGFKAYAKTETNRAFKPGAQHEEDLVVHVETPAGYIMEFDLVIECSFPNPCEEPYAITDQYASNYLGYGAPSTTIFANVWCHDGAAERVYVDTTPFNGGITELTHMGGPVWTGVVHNTNYATVGTYTCKITADSYYGPDQENTDYQLFDFIEIKVAP